MILNKFLVHYGYEVAKMQSRNVDIAYLYCDGERVWFSELDEDSLMTVDIDSMFGLFESTLYDAANEAYHLLPIELRTYHLPYDMLNQINKLNSIDMDLVSRIMYRGLPRKITIVTNQDPNHGVDSREITINPEDEKLVAAFLGCYRLAPSQMSQTYPNGIPCKIKRISNELS